MNFSRPPSRMSKIFLSHSEGFRTLFAPPPFEENDLRSRRVADRHFTDECLTGLGSLCKYWCLKAIICRSWRFALSVHEQSSQRLVQDRDLEP